MKAAVGQVRQEYAFSQRRACGLVTMSVSSYRYQSQRSDEGLRERLVKLAWEKPRFGYRRFHVLLQRKTEGSGPKLADCLATTRSDMSDMEIQHSSGLRRFAPNRLS